MPKQYIIENGAENNRWLYKIERRGTPEQVNCFHPIIEDAVIFQKKEEAVAFAKRWKARAWQLKNGAPAKQVWPE